MQIPIVLSVLLWAFISSAVVVQRRQDSANENCLTPNPFPNDFEIDFTNVPLGETGTAMHPIAASYLVMFALRQLALEPFDDRHILSSFATQKLPGYDILVGGYDGNTPTTETQMWAMWFCRYNMIRDLGEVFLEIGCNFGHREANTGKLHFIHHDPASSTGDAGRGGGDDGQSVGNQPK